MERAKFFGVQITTGFSVASASESSTGVVVTSRAGETVAGRLLVGADGVGSIVRQVLNPDQPSTKSYSGYLGVGLITENAEKIEMTLHHYPGNQVGVASCGKVSSTSLRNSVFLWTHIHIPEDEAKTATKQTVEEELERRATKWSPEVKRYFEIYKTGANSVLAHGPVYNGKPPLKWYSNKMILIGDAAHPYGPGGQGITMALKDAKALCELIVQDFTDAGKKQFQTIREKESRTCGEAAEKRNKQNNQAQTSWGVFFEGLFMKLVEFFTWGVLNF